jgi:hypothetical protein
VYTLALLQRDIFQRESLVRKHLPFVFLLVAAAVFATDGAKADTFTLTLTDASNPAFSGTGTLVIVGSPSLTNASEEYCLNGNCGGPVLTSLTFTVDGHTFSSSGASNASATFDDGVLSALGFSETVGGNFQLGIPNGNNNLEYRFAIFNPSNFGTGLISATLDPAPIGGTLPLLAGGLGLIGLLARRRKRNATPAFPA